MVKAILTEQGSGGSGGTIQLLSIQVTTRPNKTSYLAGEHFNTAGMVVKASYGISGIVLTTTEITGYEVEPNPLVDGTTAVTVKYSELGAMVTTTTPVTVTHALTSLSVTGPTKTSYEYQDTLNQTGLVVTAHYSDGATRTVTPNSVSPTALNTVTSAQAITVSYTENGITKNTSFNVVVARKSITEPSWKGTLTYNGSQQSANATSKWNNYDSAKMTIGGTYTGTNATSYNATFTPTANYRWSGTGSTNAVTKSWSIAKKTLTPTLSGPSANITGSALTQNATISGLDAYYSGTISTSISPTTGVSVGAVSGSGANRTIPLTGNGTTEGTFTLTVTFGSDSNYTAITQKTCTVTAQYWKWDTSTIPTGDAAFWAGMKRWLSGSTATERAAFLGKKVQVTLTGVVLGTTTHYVRCIGYDCDGDKTLTFQTMNCLATNMKFCSDQYGTFGNQALWTNGTTDSIVRMYCKDYYNAFPGKDSIKTVAKKYLSTQPNSTHSTACDKQYDETVFLPSENEMGFLEGATSRAGAKDEFAVVNTSKTAYQYYTANNKRTKYLGTDNDPEGVSNTPQSYWERSRCYSSGYPNCVCYVTGAGTANFTDYGNISIGLAPAFAIG